MRRGWMLVVLVGAACLVPTHAFAANGKTPSLAVLDVKAGQGVSTELARFVTSAVARAAGDTGAFKVISAEDIRALLSLEAKKQMCGAGSDACLAEIGGALGADYMVSGTLSKVGSEMNLDLSLLEVSKARNLSRVNRQFSGHETQLFKVVPSATVELLGKAMAGRQGTLVLSVSEPGASVKVDGRLVGVSPLAKQTVAAGVHLLSVEKTGFIAQQQQIKVKANAVTPVSVAMVPSPDFLDAYRSHAVKMRVGAWLTTGLAAGALGTALVFNARADQLEQKFTQQKQQYLSGGASDTKALQDLQSLSNQGLGSQTIANIGFGVAGAAAVAATYFWIAGDDPGRYRQFQVAAGPSEGGAFAAASWRFY